MRRHIFYEYSNSHSEANSVTCDFSEHIVHAHIGFQKIRKNLFSVFFRLSIIFKEKSKEGILN